MNIGEDRPETALVRRSAEERSLPMVVDRLAERGLDLARTLEPSRVIHFPEDRSLGYVRITDELLPSEDEEEPLAARGPVVIPHGKYATLVADHAVADLAPLSDLRPQDLDGLDLSQCRRWLTNSDLSHVARLTALKQVNLRDARVTDAGLARLRGLTNLQDLSLWDTPVTDAGLAHLTGLTRLQTLDLRETQVTDAGLAHLRSLTNLSSLFLSETRVTDAGLAHLSGLTSLQHLSLGNTQVTDAGRDFLRDVLPSCQVIR